MKSRLIRTLIILMSPMLVGLLDTDDIAAREGYYDIINKVQETSNIHIENHNFHREVNEAVERARFEQERAKYKAEKQIEIQRQQYLNRAKTQEVKFTQYYTGDAYGSGNTTSVGDNISNYGMNEYGMATLNGRVVVATATYGCANSSTDECRVKKYLPLAKGWHIFREGQHLELELQVNGKTVVLPAVVRDACGACFWNESRQRVDVLMKIAGLKTQVGTIRYVTED